jgi:hypothetical protein
MEIDISLPNKIFRGNSIDIVCHVDVDISECIIRAEIFDQYYASLKLSSEVIGEIDIDDDDQTFTISIVKDTTDIFHLISYLEIDIEDDNGKVQTVYFSPIKFTDNLPLRG